MNDDIETAFQELLDFLSEWYPHLLPDGPVSGKKGPCAAVARLFSRNPCFASPATVGTLDVRADYPAHCVHAQAKKKRGG